MRSLDLTAFALASAMLLCPLALAPAYGPYVEPGTAAEVDRATKPPEQRTADPQETEVDRTIPPAG